MKSVLSICFHSPFDQLTIDLNFFACVWVITHMHSCLGIENHNHRLRSRVRVSRDGNEVGLTLVVISLIEGSLSSCTVYDPAVFPPHLACSD